MFGSVEDQIVDDTKKIPAWHSNRLANHLIRRVSHTHYFSDIMLLVCLLERSSHLSSYNQQSSFLNYRSICDVRHLVYHIVVTKRLGIGYHSLTSSTINMIDIKTAGEM